MQRREETSLLWPSFSGKTFLFLTTVYEVNCGGFVKIMNLGNFLSISNLLRFSDLSDWCISCMTSLWFWYDSAPTFFLLACRCDMHSWDKSFLFDLLIFCWQLLHLWFYELLTCNFLIKSLGLLLGQLTNNTGCINSVLTLKWECGNWQNFCLYFLGGFISQPTWIWWFLF